MLEIFQYQFFQNALLACALVALTAPFLGIFFVARRSSLITDTLSHTALAGLALGLLLGVNPLIGALFAAAFAALILEGTRGKKLATDATQSLFLSGSLALAIVLINLYGNSSTNIENYLFGSILSIQTSEIWLLAGLAILVILFVRLNWQKLITLSLSAEIARADQIKIQRLKSQLALIGAIFIALSLKIIGGLLIGALIVVPILTASNFAASFKQTLFFAIIISFFGALTGLIASFYLDLPSGPSIVLVNIALFIFTKILRFFR